MASTSQKKPRPKRTAKSLPRLVFLTPDRVTDIAYAFYVVSAAEQGAISKESEDYAEAAIIVRKFKSLDENLSLESPEGIFYFGIQQIVLSLSRGIARRMRVRNENEQMAEQRKTYQLQQVSLGYVQSAFWKVVMQLSRFAIFPILAGLIGYSATQGVDLPKATPVQQDYWSYAIGLVTLIATAIISSLLTQLKNARIFTSYDEIRRQAETRYRIVAGEEYRLALKNATRLWEEFTGWQADEFMSYDGVNRVEAHAAEQFNATVRKADMSMPVYVFQATCAWWAQSPLRARLARRKTLTPAALPAGQE